MTKFLAPFLVLVLVGAGLAWLYFIKTNGDQAAYKDALRETQDGLQSFHYPTTAGRPLADFFNLTMRDSAADENQRVDPDKYMTSAGIFLPPGPTEMSILSRRLFQYGYVGFYRTMTLAPNKRFYLGLGSSRLDERAWFWAADSVFAAMVGPQGFNSRLDLNNYLQPDYATTNHIYFIKVNRQNVEFYIENALRAIVLTGLRPVVPDWTNTNGPYLVGTTSMGIAGRVPATIELEALDDLGHSVGINVRTRSHFAAADGDPSPPRKYLLYTENTMTQWNGLSTKSAISSHPVPVWGYERKTLLFQSTTAGMLIVEVYAGGGWRILHSETVMPNSLHVYNLDAEVPIARCRYVPAGTDTIAVAEWYLS